MGLFKREINYRPAYRATEEPTDKYQIRDQTPSIVRLITERNATMYVRPNPHRIY